MDGLHTYPNPFRKDLDRDLPPVEILAKLHGGDIHRNGETVSIGKFAALGMALGARRADAQVVQNRIKVLRISAGLTLEQVAAAAGTTVQQVSRLERGERRLTDEWMHRIAPILRVRPAALLSDQTPDTGEFAQNTEEVLLLRWWRLLDMREKRMIASMARDKGLEILASNKPTSRPT